jgi:hypothetical protein
MNECNLIMLVLERSFPFVIFLLLGKPGWIGHALSLDATP